MPPDLSAAPRLAHRRSAVFALCMALLTLSIPTQETVAADPCSDSPSPACGRRWPAGPDEGRDRTGLFASDAASLPGTAATPGDTAQIENGARLYRKGVTPSGKPLHAIDAGGNTISGADAACAKCHRRSGLGGTEGNRVILPITADVLFGTTSATPSPQMAARYDAVSFDRLLRDGRTPEAKQLDALMPRYQLDHSEHMALVAYLRTLRPGPDPGVTATELHLATVIAGDIAPERRAAILGVLQTYVADHNAQTRAEARRAQYGRDAMDRAFRFWRLHVWELHGNATQWPAQLQAQYQRQPVFAVVSGTGDGTWQPVHNFCERMELPCMFPSIDVPGALDPGDYTFYLSKGLVLEAEALAAYIAEQRPRVGSAKIVQVYRADDNGAIAARTLHNALSQTGQTMIDNLAIQEPTPPDPNFWTALLQDRKPTHLILWLAASDLKHFATGIGPDAHMQGVFASARHTGERSDWIPDALLDRTFLTYPYALPNERAASTARLTAWLRSRHIPPGDQRLQSETYFTITTIAGVLRHMNGLYSREYFIERLEAMAASSLTRADYPRISLGPGQRYASKGCYIVRAGKNGEKVTAVSRWMTP